DDFARRGADALRQRSGVQAHRQAHCYDRVTEHRHCRITQYGLAPTRIAAAGRVPVTAERSDGHAAGAYRLAPILPHDLEPEPRPVLAVRCPPPCAHLADLRLKHVLNRRRARQRMTRASSRVTPSACPISPASCPSRYRRSASLSRASFMLPTA